MLDLIENDIMNIIKSYYNDKKISKSFMDEFELELRAYILDKKNKE